ncbi:alkyl/aryl-sulfatase [Ponticaulis profundi]|uniref:Alkyl/aryl-sulfatase n=1 Tax=Ponticaulis profundi TaxID=2665222 RepID=A0ABW1SA41_9PROT
MKHTLKGAVSAVILCTLMQPGYAQDVTASELPSPSSKGEATQATATANAAVASRLPIDDQQDYEDAKRGFLASEPDLEAIYDENGKVVWPMAKLSSFTGEAPDTVNPSLWRQAQLSAMHGIFEVKDGIYQVRGYDISVMTVIRGETGWIIVDPLSTRETAAAAMELVTKTLGERPITGLIYTHGHADHYGGAAGVIDPEEAEAQGVPIIAPLGFADSISAESAVAGIHMSRRAVPMLGTALEVSEIGHVSSGLGPRFPNGKIGMIAPTEEIGGDDYKRTIDGIEFVFVDAAGTEAPAEFMFYLPQFDAICTAEVATRTLHNALTPRGAKVRDFLRWSEVLDHMLLEYGDKVDVSFASHHWPVWDQENIQDYLRRQRDVYRYTHDQVLRRANKGQTMIEIAEDIPEPEIQQQNFDTRGYYGTNNHNTKAVYQFYYGWWDGNPANYYQHPPVQKAERFVDAMGGIDAVIAEGIEAFEAGDYRWSAEVLNHAVFAAPDNKLAREWLSATYEQLGFQAESGTWRSYFLTAAREVLNGPPGQGSISRNASYFASLPTARLLDLLAVQYAPERMSREPYDLNIVFTDTEEMATIQVGKATAFPRTGVQSDEAAATMTTTKKAFVTLFSGSATVPDLIASGDASVSGDEAAFNAYIETLDGPEFWFNIVEP